MDTLKFEMRKAVPADLKANNRQLKIGQIFAIVDQNGYPDGLFTIEGDEDPFILKSLLDTEQIYVPLVNHKLKEFLKQDDDDV